MEPVKKKSLLAKLLLLFTTVIWGSTFVVLKDTLDSLPMYFILAVRFLLGGILVGVAFPKKWKTFTPDMLWRGGITGVVLAAAYITQTIGLNHTTPGNNAFLTATYAVMVPFMMWAITKKAPTVFNVVAAILGVVGIGLVSFDGGFTSFNLMGEGMTLVCSVFFALQIIFIAVFGKGKDSITFTSIELVSAGLIMLIIYLCTEVHEPISLDFDSTWKLAYLTIMGTAFALVAMTWGMAHTETSSASLIMSLESVFGVIFSIAIYKEKLTLQVGIGFLVIFIALFISEYVNELYLSGKLRLKPSKGNK
ncbi:MAG: DMT family transporter [Clostridia bacterium]|nr:DMT family transporter [Clostridia bacterium]